MTEDEFKILYSAELPIYSAYGNYVNQKITEGLLHKLGNENKIKTFIKIPVTPRVKEIDSIISKAFFRNKNYANPYQEITDKVGVRFVVLLVKDIELIKEVVESYHLWEFSKDRDFEEERKKNPLIFDYQSVHYIVRNKERIDYEGQDIPINTPCEIQIRTLLQHAYSELTHDTVYKPQSITSPEVIRSVARSMALIETTDKIFEEVDMTLINANNNLNKFLESIAELYKCIIKPDYEPKMNYFILDAYRDVLNEVNVSDLESFLNSSSYLSDIIKRNFSASLIYRQPIILFIYYLITKKKNICKKYWPLTDSELRPLFTDLGIAFERN
jgi:ppGpp synthetase/RelA/SpoT-type nucleotidyltranferase